MLHGLHDGDDIGLHHALDLGEVQHHLGAVLRLRAIELRHELVVGQHYHIGEFAVVKAHAFDVLGDIGRARGADQLDEEIDDSPWVAPRILWLVGVAQHSNLGFARDQLPFHHGVPATRPNPKEFLMLRYALALMISLFASPAFALPAPMSDQELMDKSDLVAVVRVLSVSCTTVSKDDKSGQNLPAYLAKVRLLDVKKATLGRGTRCW